MIKSKIEEQIDRTGTTLQKLEKFWNYTTLQARVEDSRLTMLFGNELEKESEPKEEEKEKEQEVQKEKSSQKMAIEEFNQLIGRSLMFTAQMSGNFDEEKQALREKQTGALKVCLERSLRIKESLEALHNTGHFQYSSYQLKLENPLEDLNTQLIEIMEQL